MGRGFSLIELLVALSVIAILSAIAVPSYMSYRERAVKAALMHDLRTCLSHIEAQSHIRNGADLKQLVAECPKGEETKSIQVVSEQPLVLKAEAVDYNLECVYDLNTGRFSCR